jgi:prepilin-type processing-associated H-X9-DG protein
MFGFANGRLMFSSHSWRGQLMFDLPPALPRWFHVGVTRHPDGTTILFVDGVELGRGMTRRGRLGRGANPLIIGAATNGPDLSRTHARFDGRIDEVLIYDRALSAAEMEALAARRQPAAGS